MKYLKWFVVLMGFAVLAGCAEQLPTAQPGINRSLAVPITIEDNTEKVIVVIYTDADVIKRDIKEDVKALQDLTQDNAPVVEISPELQLDGLGL